MFHAYRSGKYPISDKAWRKLEAAEEAHARTHLAAAKAMSERLLAEQENAQSSSPPKQPGVGESAKGAYAGEEERRSQTAATGPELVKVLTRIASALEELVEHQRRRE